MPGAIFGPVPRLLWNDLVADEQLDDDHRLLQALNCLAVETPAGRVLVATGIGERIGDKARAMRRSEGDPVVPTLRTAGVDSGGVDLVLMSHLHFDHAGGLLLADGTRAFPRARIVAQRAEWEIALGDNSRLVASYDQPELRLVRDWGAEGWVEGEHDCCPGCPSCRPVGTRPGTRPWSSAAAARRSPSSATCSCDPGPRTRAGSPRSTTSRSTRSPARPSCSGRPWTSAGPSCSRTRQTNFLGRSFLIAIAIASRPSEGPGERGGRPA